MSLVSVTRVVIGLVLGLACVFAIGGAHAAQVTLTWDPSTDEAVAGYKLYYGTASRNYTSSIDAQKTTSCVVPELQNGTTYYFAATAYNADRIESGFSNEVVYTTPYVETTAPPPPCAYSISSSAVSFGASAGSGSVNVTASSGCAWTSSGVPSWMTVTAGSSGTGNGTFIYSVAANTTTASRSATLTIAGKSFTVTQAGAPPASYTITASATTGGSITPSGTVSVSKGGTQTFNIQSGSGYSLSDVKVNGVSVGKVTSYTFTNVTANHTISATFAPSGYTISVTKNGTGSGTVTANPSQSVYTSGTTVKLTATPATGSSFTGWSGACSGPLNTCTLTMQSNKAVTAMFTINTYSVKASATTGGWISPSGSVLINYGASQTFTMAPLPGYKISNVRVDGVYVGAVSSFTFSKVNSGHTIEAFFSAQ